MSVPDAVPLPRMGEVFFDVRGNSRSMRLSWYADTGVAVFSIWQAGMCTGTFRLPIADLGRMIELLQRGPAPRRRGPVPVGGSERGDRDFDRPSGSYQHPPGDEPRSGSGDDLADFVQGDFATDYGSVDYRDAEHRAAGPEQHSGYEYPRGDYSGDRTADYQARGYGADERAGPGYGSDYAERDWDREYADREYGAAGYGRSDPGEGGYRAADQESDYGYGEHRADGGYRSSSYEPADYWSRSPGGAEPDLRGDDYSAAGFDAGRGADPGRDYRAGGAGYSDDRVVPPYVQSQDDSYLNDNLPGGAGYRGNIGDPAYPADRRPVSPSHGYPEPSGPQDSYSYGSDYRYRSPAETDSEAGNGVGRSSGRRAG